MNLAAGLGGTFIVLDVTTLAFSQIINMRETGHLRDRLDGDKLKGGNGSSQLRLFTFSHASKTFTRDEVVTRFRLTQECKNPGKG